MPRVQKDLLSGVGGGVSACERVSEGERERERDLLCVSALCACRARKPLVCSTFGCGCMHGAWALQEHVLCMQAFTCRSLYRMVMLAASMAGDDEDEMALFIELDLLESFHPMKKGA